ncbi:hypothetical protein HETIRDRAFT_165192 [Heterobasidion irregulare TC 32-1]|uniref:Uncharacterized protein n=1 Tax=Heterobasidion irregulare (strain TC 32-1) TaxID=747525 RepID=W4K9A7_HETIT|nr:uncharacterized protein HETIRDRAFT_165192 [Heterobasidion irregulare TC 32-1]ETW82363.1 hypothetical protein HETIRDRAFT_165192 [Heterobasidion irregulare TC 32-1]
MMTRNKNKRGIGSSSVHRGINSSYLQGEKAAPELRERFADRLLSAFTKKELSIDNWDPLSEHSQDLKLILGPGAKRPVHIILTEMTPREAATFAAGEFASIALQAQSH